MSEEIKNIKLDELVPNSDLRSTSLVPVNLHLVGHLAVNVSVIIGTAELTLEKLFSLKAGDVLELNEHLNSPVTLIVDGAPVAQGNLIAINDNFGVQITELAQ